MALNLVDRPEDSSSKIGLDELRRKGEVHAALLPIKRDALHMMPATLDINVRGQPDLCAWCLRENSCRKEQH